MRPSSGRPLLAAIRDGPGANKPCCQSICGSLAAFFVISSLFSLLASRAAARPGEVQTLMQYRCSSVVDYFHKGLPASVCALPASQFSSFHFYYIPLCVTNMGKCKPLQLLSLLLLLASAVAAAFSCYRSLQQKGRAQARACE